MDINEEDVRIAATPVINEINEIIINSLGDDMGFNYCLINAILSTLISKFIGALSNEDYTFFCNLVDKLSLMTKNTHKKIYFKEANDETE